jgi:O-antigen ligase
MAILKEWFRMNRIITKQETYILLIILSLQLTALSGVRLEVSDFVIIGIVFLLFIYLFRNSHYTIRISPISLIILALLFFSILSATAGGLNSLISTSNLFKSILIFFLVVNFIRTKNHVIFTIKALILVTTFSAIIGIVQEIIYVLTGASLVGFVAENMKPMMYQETSFGRLLRVPAFTGLHAVLVNYIVVSIIIAINLLLYSVIKKRKEKLIFFISIVLMFTALLLTFSNSGLLVISLAIIVSIYSRWRHLAIHFTLILLVAVVISWLVGYVEDFKNTMNLDISLRGDLGIRLHLMKAGIIGFFSQHPLIGVGIGNGSQYTQNINHWPVHNAFLLIADEVGVFGLLAYLFLFGAVVIRQLIVIVRLTNHDDKAIMISLLLGLIGVIVNLQFHPSYSDSYIFLFIAIVESTGYVLLRGHAKPLS